MGFPMAPFNAEKNQTRIIIIIIMIVLRSQEIYKHLLELCSVISSVLGEVLTHRIIIIIIMFEG